MLQVGKTASKIKQTIKTTQKKWYSVVDDTVYPKTPLDLILSVLRQFHSQTLFKPLKRRQKLALWKILQIRIWQLVNIFCTQLSA